MSASKKTDEVPAALDGQRLDRIVALMGDISRSDAASAIAAGGVLVDGGVALSGKVRLTEGQVISLDTATIPQLELPRADSSVEFGVVHEDDHVIVVDKPAGLGVHPGAGNSTGTLANGLLARFPDIEGVGDPMRPGIVHRLDAGSSGLLVVARTNHAAEYLIDQFADHTCTRRYEALVWGVPDAPHGIIDAPLGRNRNDPLKDGGGCPWQVRTDRLPSHRYLFGASRCLSTRMSSRNGPHTSDSRASCVNQSPVGRGPDLRTAPPRPRCATSVLACRRTCVQSPWQRGASHVPQPACERSAGLARRSGRITSWSIAGCQCCLISAGEVAARVPGPAQWQRYRPRSNHRGAHACVYQPGSRSRARRTDPRGHTHRLGVELRSRRR